MPEVIDAIETILSGWEEANTNSRTPLIKKIWETNSAQTMSNQDYLLLSQSANNVDYPSLGLKWKDQDWIISMDIRTDSRGQLILMDDEIIRLLDASNTAVAGYSWLEVRGRRDLVNDTNKPFFRAVRDVLVRKLSEVI